MMLGRCRSEAAKDHAGYATRRRRQFRDDRADGNSCRLIGREAINSGRDRRKCDALKPMGCSEIERGPIAGRKQTLFPLPTAIPHRPDGVDHVFGWKPIAEGDLRSTCLAAAKRPALHQQFGASGAMNGAIHPTSAEKSPVRRIDDDVDRKGRDVGYANLKSRRAGGGDMQRSHVCWSDGRHGRERITPIRLVPPPSNPRCCARRYHRNARRGNGAPRVCRSSAACRRSRSRSTAC
jgi:hypothetical protein